MCCVDNNFLKHGVCYQIDLTLNLGTVTGKINTSPGFHGVHSGVLIEQAMNDSSSPQTIND